MSFESFGDFLAMGHHGPYVWSAYGISLLVLAINVAEPLLAAPAAWWKRVLCNAARIR